MTGREIEQELDSDGSANAIAHKGRVYADLWLRRDGHQAGDACDRVRVIMTPGDAMALCSRLAAAASSALKQSI